MACFYRKPSVLSRASKIFFCLIFFTSFTLFSQIDSVKLASLKAASANVKIYSDSVTKIIDSLEAEIAKIETSVILPVKKWTTGGKITTDISQVRLTNWVGGGQNSISLISTANFFFNYKSEKISLATTIDLHYGIIKQGSNKVWWKNDDQHEISIKLDKKAFGTWNYSTFLEAYTQFSPGYNYPDDSTLISDFLAPGYVIFADGLDWQPFPYLTFLAAPLTIKATIVNNTTLANAGAFGVMPAITDDLGNIIKNGKKFRGEIGGYVKLNIQKEVYKGVFLDNNLEFFSNYLNNPQNIDVIWTSALSFQLLKYFAFTIHTHLIYDNDIEVPVDRDGDNIKESTGPRLQFEQMLGLGFKYTM